MTSMASSQPPTGQRDNPMEWSDSPSEEEASALLQSPRPPSARAAASRWSRRAFAPSVVLLGLLVVGFLALGGYRGGLGEPSSTRPSRLDFIELDSGTFADNETAVNCSLGTQYFSKLPNQGPRLVLAVDHGLGLVRSALVHCPVGDLNFPLVATEFVGSSPTHHVQAWHKYASSCSSETYRLMFTVDNSQVFVLEVDHTFDTNSWTLLKASPGVCLIATGEPSTPFMLPTTEPIVKEAADFAAAMLENKLRAAGCLQPTEHVKVEKLLRVELQVLDGARMNMTLSLKGLSSSSDTSTLTLAVYERCDVHSPCLRQLILTVEQAHNICGLRQGGRRRLSGEIDDEADLEMRGGTVDEDATEFRVVQRHWLRSLNGNSRAPLQLRRIKDAIPGSTAASHDPTEGFCYTKVPVLDQGACGSCYAAAVAAMIGLRQCVYDEQTKKAFTSTSSVSTSSTSSTPAPSSSTYTTAIRWATVQSKCFDISSGSTQNGNTIQTWDCGNSHPNQQFIVPAQGSTGVIRWASHPSKCVDVAGGSRANGNRLQMWDCNANHPNQQFVMPATGSGIIKWAAADRCIDISNGNRGNGQALQLWQCYSTSPNMQFLLRPPAEGTTTIATTTTTTTAPPVTGPIQWKTMTFSTKCFDVADGSTRNGNRVQTWSCNAGHPNQQFVFPAKGATGMIRWAANPNKCMDVAGGSSANGNKLQLWDCVNNDANQQFTVSNTGALQWAANDICVDVPNGYWWNGVALHFWSCSPGHRNQRFILPPSAAPARQLTAGNCRDDPSFSYLNDGVHTCSWFAANDPGCKFYTDEGQMTACRQTCKTCVVDAANPWQGAWYRYLPSIADVAGCASSQRGGSPRGCDGGNVQSVWDNWMRHLSRDLWIAGAPCLPYKYKCMESSGVVNPLSSGQCSSYTDRQLWQRPCSCIPQNQRPQQVTCPTSVPSQSCSHTVPVAMFVVMTSQHGLSKADAVANMQRHIVEYGPIYVAFQTTSEFMRWPWSTKPIYTGGSNHVGGHAVIMVGWGTSTVPYWIIRNSWSNKWAHGGYCGFWKGVNLDGIESRSVAATMPARGFRDWSIPNVVYRGWGGSYWRRSGGTVLTRFDFQPKFICSKDATLRVSFSNHVPSVSSWNTGVPSVTKTAQVRAGVEYAFPAFDIAPQCHFVTPGVMHMGISAVDAGGNTFTDTVFIQMSTVASQGPCSR